MSIYKVYSIGRTWSWPVMSAAAVLFRYTIVLYSTKNEKICSQSKNRQTKTEFKH